VENRWSGVASGLRWTTLLALMAMLALGSTGVVPGRVAVIAGVALECGLSVVVVVQAVRFRRAYRTARSSSDASVARPAALMAGLNTVLPGPVAFLVRHELLLIGSLFQWAARRYPPGVRLPYDGAMRPLLWGVTAVSMIEVAVVELVVPWPVVRWILLVLGGYGLVWICGFAASLAVRPHTIVDGTLWLRFAHFTEFAVPLPPGSSIRPELHGSHRKTIEYTDGTLSLSVLGVTNALLTLPSPTQLRIDAGTTHEIHKLRFRADNPGDAARVAPNAP
jgi:hypothetical protein